MRQITASTLEKVNEISPSRQILLLRLCFLDLPSIVYFLTEEIILRNKYFLPILGAKELLPLGLWTLMPRGLTLVRNCRESQWIVTGSEAENFLEPGKKIIKDSHAKLST